MQELKSSGSIIAATAGAGSSEGAKILKRALVVASGALMTFVMPYASAHGDKSAEGVWRVTRTPISCATGQQVAPSFPAIMAFNKDGIVTGFGVGPGATPEMGSPDYGTWKREPAPRHYSFRLLANNYTAGGAFDGTTEVVGSMEVARDGDGFAYTATVHFYDANGAPLFTGCGRATATRFE